MAQTNNGGKTTKTNKLDISEVRAKVVAFKNQIKQIRAPEILKGYLNFLCPTIEEKVAFVSMFDKTYPQDKEIQKILAEWLDEEFAKHCNQQIVKGEVNKLKGIYQAVYGYAPEKQTSMQDENENPAKNAEQPQQPKKKIGLMSKLFGGLFGKKKGEVSKLSSEELSAAKGQTLAVEKTNIPDYNAEYKLQKYNERVAKRAEMSRAASLAYGKDISVMSR